MMLAAFLLFGIMTMLTGCSADDDEVNDNGDSQPASVDAGPSYTDKTVDVNRDGNAYRATSMS